MVQDARTHVFIAGPEALLPQVDKALAQVVGSRRGLGGALRAAQGARAAGTKFCIEPESGVFEC